MPHGEIMEAIMRASFGIIAYPPSPHIQNSMPTKLYEYVALNLPILLLDHKPWVKFCQQYNAAIVLVALKPKELLSKMKSTTFYTKVTFQVSWISEEIKLLDLLRNI